MPIIARKRRVAHAATMSVITGSMTVFMATLRNHGFGDGFVELWLKTVVVVYPTIMFSILVIGPRVHRLIERMIPHPAAD